MRIYVAYKLSGADVEKLRLKLVKISKMIEKLGHESFIFIRDIQDWKPGGMKPEEVMKRARIEMRKSDVILVVLETSEKGEGLLIESGYMKGLGKMLIVASKGDCRGFLLKGIADWVFEYSNNEEFEAELIRTFRKFTGKGKDDDS